MDFVLHDEQEWEVWRGGVLTRLWAAASTGSKSLCLGEQILEPGSEAPLHWHYSEEIVTVLEGSARVTVDEESVDLESAGTVIFPAQSRHGFVNTGSGKLHVVGVFAWPFYETYWEHEDETGFTREWEAQAGGIRRRLLHVPEAPAVPEA